MNTKERTPVPALGDGWFLLQDDEVLQDGDKVSAAGIDVDGNTWPETVCVGQTVRVWRRNNPDYFCARYFGPAEESEPAAKPIDWTKPVRTKDGRAVRVLCTDGPGDYPVIGIVDGECRCRTWTLDGIELTGNTGPCDLENTPQRIQREYWVNVYPSTLSPHHFTKQNADNDRCDDCLACVKITIDCEEGEGL